MHTFALYAGYGLLIIFVGMEVLRERNKRSTGQEAGTPKSNTRSDRGSTILIFAAYTVALVVSPILSHSGIGNIAASLQLPLLIVGLIFMLLGIVLRVWSMNTLGQYYTRILSVSTSQHVVTAGPYHIVRHPGYLGSLLAWVGFTLVEGNWIVILGVLCLMILTYSYRMQAEEAMLQDFFGEEYQAYMQHTRRIIPLIY